MCTLRKAIVLGLCGSLLFACGLRSAIPDATLQLLDGRRLALNSIPEKVTIVYFWATSCTVCRAEQDDLTRFYQRHHGRGVEMIGVAMPYDRPDAVLSYVRAKQIPYPIALDIRGITTQAFGEILGTPTSFILVKNAGVQQKITGAIDFPRLEVAITKLLQSAG